MLAKKREGEEKTMLAKKEGEGEEGAQKEYKVSKMAGHVDSPCQTTV